ncbi:protein of unknown function [Shinella sp. WSC3-e]|nr:conserved hypothetical protein [Rhizobiaceae bacterium]CAK7258669.1 protein of unknown function [Shinella sp. WSC3-e]
MKAISPRPAIPASLASQLLTSSLAADEVTSVANYLAELMQGLHGGQWRVSINHDSCFVCIARDFK